MIQQMLFAIWLQNFASLCDRNEKRNQKICPEISGYVGNDNGTMAYIMVVMRIIV